MQNLIAFENKQPLPSYFFKFSHCNHNKDYLLNILEPFWHTSTRSCRIGLGDRAG